LYRFVHDDLSRADFYETTHITNEKYTTDETPLAEKVENDEVSEELSRYSYAYLRHLFKVNEPLAPRLATLVNLRFYLELMRRLREEKDEAS